LFFNDKFSNRSADRHERGSLGELTGSGTGAARIGIDCAAGRL